MEPAVPSRSPLSWIVRRLDHVLAHSAVTAIVGMSSSVASSSPSPLAGFPESWEVAFSTVASAVTLVMVFVLHHAQHREQAATQLKLDELIRAMPQADDRYVHVQAAEDDEVQEMEQRHIEHHQATRRIVTVSSLEARSGSEAERDDGGVVGVRLVAQQVEHQVLAERIRIARARLAARQQPVEADGDRFGAPFEDAVGDGDERRRGIEDQPPALVALAEAERRVGAVPRR